MSPREPEMVSPQELGEILGFGETKIYEIFRELPSYKIGKSLRVRRRDLDEWLEGYRRDPAENGASSPTEKTAC